MAYYSSGTEGEVFDDGCSSCIHGMSDEIMCPIALVQMEFNYDQCKNDKLKELLSMLVDQKKGCSMKPIIDQIRKDNIKPKCLQRKLVFGDVEQINAIHKCSEKK